MPDVTSAASSVNDATVTGRCTSAPDCIDHIDRRAAAAVEDRRRAAAARPARRPRAKRDGRGHAEGDGVVRVLDREARRIGAGGRVGLRRELAQRAPRSCGRAPTTAARVALDLRASPSQVSGSATTASFSPRWASRATGWPIATTWPGSAERRGDDAVGVGLEVGIAELVAREIERAPRALEPAFGLVVRRLLAVEVGDRGEAACP